MLVNREFDRELTDALDQARGVTGFGLMPIPSDRKLEDFYHSMTPTEREVIRHRALDRSEGVRRIEYEWPPSAMELRVRRLLTDDGKDPFERTALKEAEKKASNDTA